MIFLRVVRGSGEFDKKRKNLNKHEEFNQTMAVLQI
jgi:hypothetical protein